MGQGYHETMNEDGSMHCTIYGDDSRHSWDEDASGNITNDHITYNDDNSHIDGPDHNINNIEYTPEIQAGLDSPPK